MEVDTSGSVGVRGRGMSEEFLLPSLTPEHTPTNTPQQGQLDCRKNRTAGIGAPGTSRQYPAGCVAMR